MPSSKVVPQAVGREAADAAHAEITDYIELRSSGVVQQQLDKVLDLNTFLNSPGLQKTNTLVVDFLKVYTISKPTPPDI
jgi:hypothetical protein